MVQPASSHSISHIKKDKNTIQTEIFRLGRDWWTIFLVSFKCMNRCVYVLRRRSIQAETFLNIPTQIFHIVCQSSTALSLFLINKCSCVNDTKESPKRPSHPGAGALAGLFFTQRMVRWRKTYTKEESKSDGEGWRSARHQMVQWKEYTMVTLHWLHSMGLCKLIRP